jgi:hypothetical protein
MQSAMRNGLRRGSATALARVIASSGRARVPVRGMASGKDIKYGVDARAQLLIGVDRLAEAVKVTLGPKVPLSPPPSLILSCPLIECGCACADGVFGAGKNSYSRPSLRTAKDHQGRR